MTAGRRTVVPEEVGAERHAAVRPLLRSMVLVSGASVFAYLFGVVVHEVGHYVGNVIVGIPNETIVLHPFDLSYNVYGDLSGVNADRLAFGSAAGPLLNVILGVGVGLFLWRWRAAGWLPIVMWGPVALLQESVGMIIGLVDYPDVGSDWVVVMVSGVAPAVIAVLSVALAVAGSVWILLVLPLAGVRADDAYRRKLVIFAVGIPLLLLGAVVYLSLIGSSSPSPPGMVEQNRWIALGASVTLVALLAALHRPLFSRLDKLSHSDVADVTRQDAWIAVSMGAVVFVFTLAFFN